MTRPLGGVEPPGAFPQSAEKAELVECWGAKVVDQTADIVDVGSNVMLDGSEDVLGGLRVVIYKEPGRVELESQPGERRAEPVVEVTAQPPTFLLLGRDEP